MTRPPESTGDSRSLYATRTASIRIVAPLVAATLLFTTGCGGKVSDKTLQVVGYPTVVETIEREKELIILDARSSERYNAGHIPGAIHLPLSAIDERTARDRFEAYDAVIVYGEDPGADLAKAVAKRLLQLGVDDLVYFEDGYAEYVRRGGQIAR